LGIKILVLVAIFLIPLFTISAFAEKTISDDSTGGDCTTFGTWDSGTKTCTLSTDLSEGIVIGSSGITLDGNGFKLFGPGGDSENYGILLQVKKDVTIKDVTVDNFYIGIQLRDSFENTITKNTVKNIRFEGIDLESFSYGNLISENTVTDNGGHGITIGSPDNIVENNFVHRNKVGISDFGSSGNIIRENDVQFNDEDGLEITGDDLIIQENIISNNLNYGIRSMFTSNIIISNNIISHNLKGIYLGAYDSAVYQNEIENNSDYGLINELDSNEIYNNNFLSNGISAKSNIILSKFSLPLPIGGNYWSDYSLTCKNDDGDHFCDDPYPFSGGTINVNDNFVWTIQDGWLTEIITDGDITVESIDGNGVVVDYSVSATFDGNPISITCEPASGSTFPIGQTTVLCTASTGVTSTFSVTVNESEPEPEPEPTPSPEDCGPNQVFQNNQCVDVDDSNDLPEPEPTPSPEDFPIDSSNPRIVDMSGNPLSEIIVGEQVQVVVDMTNNSAEAVSFTYQVLTQMKTTKDNEAWVAGSLKSGQSFTPALSLTPKESGEYKITISIIESHEKPNLLSEQHIITLTVVEPKPLEGLEKFVCEWSNTQTSDLEYLQNIQVLLNQKELILPPLSEDAEIEDYDPNRPIPDWVRNNANYWCDNKISYEEMETALSWLVMNGYLSLEQILIETQEAKEVQEPEAEPVAKPEPEKLGIASFVDESEDPQHYVDRYNTEPEYKEWFDENYPEYSSIFEAVGLEEPREKIPEWVRNIFIWYAEGQITEEDLIGAIEFLVNEGIIKVKT